MVNRFYVTMSDRRAENPWPIICDKDLAIRHPISVIENTYVLHNPLRKERLLGYPSNGITPNKDNCYGKQTIGWSSDGKHLRQGGDG
jgi:hypothetical protein